MAIGIEELIHECFPKLSRMGIAKNKSDETGNRGREYGKKLKRARKQKFRRRITT